MRTSYESNEGSKVQRPKAADNNDKQISVTVNIYNFILYNHPTRYKLFKHYLSFYFFHSSRRRVSTVFERLPNHERELVRDPHFYVQYNPISHSLRGSSPVTYNTSGSWSPLCTSLLRSLSTLFSLLSRRCQSKRWRLRAGRNKSPSHRPRASDFEGKPNNSRKQVQ
jgi:hypothetical protein